MPSPRNIDPHRAAEDSNRLDLSTLALPPAWYADALCAEAPTEMFFPEKPYEQLGYAKKFCAACPVSIKCLQYALDNNETWGGRQHGDPHQGREDGGMSERSVRCPECIFSFARLVDAGGYRAYHCPTCDWCRPTTDTRPGNRPADVCGLCDRPIDLTDHDHHLYLGPGWVHGGGRENLPIHRSCPESMRRYECTQTLWTDGCSCPSEWQAITGDHMRGCEAIA